MALLLQPLLLAVSTSILMALYWPQNCRVGDVDSYWYCSWSLRQIVGIFACIAPLLIPPLLRLRSCHSSKPLRWPTQSHATFNSTLPQPKLPQSDQKRPHSKVKRALCNILELLMRDFVHWWYDDYVGGSSDFTNDLTDMGEFALQRLSEGINRVEWTNVLRQNGIRSINDMLRVYRLCERDLDRADPQFRRKSMDERRRCVLHEVQKSHPLHEAVENPEEHLRKLSRYLLEHLLPPKDLHCSSLRTLMRELLTCKVFMPVFASADDFYINSAIVGWVSSFEPGSSSSDNSVYSHPRPPPIDECPLSVPLANPIKTLFQEDHVTNSDTTESIRTTAEGRCRRRRQPSVPRDLSRSPWKIEIVRAVIRFDPRPFVLYVLEVNYAGTSWCTAKRYSDFVDLHSKLRRTTRSFKAKLPRKHLFNNLKRWFIEQRRMDLRSYLVQIQWNKECIESDVWMRFLVPETISVPSSVPSPDCPGDSPPSLVCDSPRCQYDLYSSNGRCIPMGADISGNASRESRVIAQELFDLVEEVFDLDNASMRAWIAARIIMVSFDGFFAKVVHEKIHKVNQEDFIAAAIDSIGTHIWPGGELYSPAEPPSEEDKLRIQRTAEQLLQESVPAALKLFLGEKFCRKGISKLFGFLQEESLVKHFVFTFLDTVVEGMFAAPSVPAA